MMAVVATLDRRRRERGFALVLALSSAAILALILSSVQRLTLADARAARMQSDVSELGAAADAAINIAILRMLGPSATQPPVDTTPFQIDFAERRIAVSVQDEIGKIDLNLVGRPVLLHLLMSAGLDQQSAEQMSDRIANWRELGLGSRSDDTRSVPDRAASSPYGPRGRPFQSVAELQQVEGMSPDVFGRVAPLLTIYSQAPWVDPAFAGLTMLRLLSAVDPNAAANLRRLETVLAGLQRPDAGPGVVLGHAFTIVASVSDGSAVHVMRTAIIRLTGQPGSELWIYRWY